MAELADAPDSKSGSLAGVGVRPSLRAPQFYLLRQTLLVIHKLWILNIKAVQ